MQRNIQHFYKILLFILLSTISFQTALASGTKIVPRGTVVTITWNIANAPATERSCKGGTTYPTYNDIYTNWTTVNGGVHPIDSNGNGSLQLGAANIVGTSTFKCTNYTSNPPAYDTTMLVVTDCSTDGKIWNGTACVTPSPCYQGQSISSGACLYKLGGTTNSGNTVNLPNVTVNYTGSANVTCNNNGSLSFYGIPTCKKTTCDLPWGGSIASGTSVTAYSSKTVDPPTTCADVSQTLTCKTGVLSGNTTTYKYPSCSVNGSNSLNFSPSTCTIAVGASTCTVSASWTTAPSVTSPNLFDANPNSSAGIISKSASSSKTTVTVAGGGTTFQLRDGTSVLLSQTITPTCESGSSWDGVNNVCKSDTPPSSSNSLNLPDSCIIADGAKTCTVVASWTTDPSVTDPQLIDKNMGTTLSTSGSNSGLTVWVAYGGTTFSLNNGATELLTKTVTASCGASSRWDVANQVCKLKVQPPTGPITCAIGQYWNETTSQCDDCQNGGCTSTDTASETGKHIPDGWACNNGATNPPSCNQCPNNYAYINGSCIACNGGTGCSGTGGSDGNPVGGLICTDSGDKPSEITGMCGSLPASISSFVTEPRTSTLGGYTVVSWDIKNPAPGACRIDVKTVCDNSGCTADQNTSAAALKGILQSALDSTMGTAQSPVQRATGRKSIQVKYTTDFTLTCGAGSAATRFLVTKNHEG